MSTTQYVLNIALLAYILLSNLGTREVTHRRLLAPVVLVAIAGWVFLRNLPGLGNDHALEAVGLAAGVVFGLIASACVSLRRDLSGRLVSTAGWAFAAVWVLVIGGRMAFAYGADHWFPMTIARFSRDHLITGADAWTAAFVIMALAMVLTRLLATVVRGARVRTHAVQPA
jgi:hypothetical protein